MQKENLIGKSVITTKTPEEIRSAVLNKIGEGFNTMHTLIRATGLDNSTITREIEFMSGLYIETRPGPPVVSYWFKGKAPKGQVALDDEGRVVEIRKAPAQKFSAAPPVEEIIAPEPVAPAVPEEDVLMAPPANSDGSGEYFEKFPLALLEDHPDNPRGLVDEDDPVFKDLRDSIRAVGVQEPLVVTPIKGSKKFRIVIGHRRARASAAADLETVPVIVRKYASAAEEEVVMLTENIQRQNLKPTAEARAFKKIYERLGKDIHAVARELSLTQSYIMSRLQLLKLEVGIQIMLDRGEIGVSTGVIISTLPAKRQLKVLPRAQRMKTADLRALVTKMKNSYSDKIPKTKYQKRRVTTDEEAFTRRWALDALRSVGEAGYITVRAIIDAFDDICLDSCLETKDESICNGCPVPRMIASITRRHKRIEEI